MRVSFRLLSVAQSACVDIPRTSGSILLDGACQGTSCGDGGLGGHKHAQKARGSSQMCSTSDCNSPALEFASRPFVQLRSSSSWRRLTLREFLLLIIAHKEISQYKGSREESINPSVMPSTIQTGPSSRLSLTNALQDQSITQKEVLAK